MSTTGFNIQNLTYRRVIGNGLTYRVPMFQRDYSWGEEQWDDLWQDIIAVISSPDSSSHYLGYLVLQTEDDKNFQIIDGQQRLTTLSLIVLAAMYNLKKLVNKKINLEQSQSRLNNLRNSYIGFEDAVTLLIKPKLVLNNSNNDYYQNQIVKLPDSLPKRGFSSSVHQMRKAFEFYCDKIANYTETKSDKGQETVQLIEELSDKLFFTVMNVSDEFNAYVVFETLNARGVTLSGTDLLKNYLFTILHNNNNISELKTLEDRWSAISKRIEENKLLDFVRIHWNSRNPLIRKLGLYKTIRSKIITPQAVFEFIDNLDADIDSYLNIVEPNKSSWNEKCKNYSLILKTFRIAQAYPAILAARRVMDDPEFEKFLRLIVIISFRYNIICGLNPNDLEAVYSSISQLLYSSGDHSFDRIRAILRPVYPTKEQFKAAFKNKRFAAKSNQPLVHYILKSIDSQSLETNPAKDEFHSTIEHILPLNPKESEWVDFTADDIESYSLRIGNLLQLEASLNRDIGNSEFAAKTIVYGKSKYRSTQEIASYPNWSIQAIEARLDHMADQANHIWRIEQLEK